MDEDGRFTELAGPELQNLSVMTEGTDKGTAERWDFISVRIVTFVSSFLPLSYIYV